MRTVRAAFMEGAVLQSPDVRSPGADPSGPTPRAWRALERWPWLIGSVLAALALSLNLAGNARTGLWDRDEPRYAVAVREMRARGDWLVPTFNGEPRYHKPILVYWLMGLGTALGGESPFGVRLASALAGVGSCVLVWRLGRVILGEWGGALAGLMLAVSPIMVAESKLATTDAMLAFFVLACQACLYRLSQGPSRIAAALFWVCLSLATLTKGPIGVVFLLASSLPAWWWGWPAQAVWQRLGWRRGLLAFAGLTLPWYLAIGVISRGEFFSFAVGNQLLPRVTSRMEQHGGFPGYYLLLSLLAMYPWAAFMPAAACAAWLRRGSSSALAFLLGWAIGPWVLLECIPTRLVHYYVPAYPAWALLAAWLVEAVAAQEVSLRRWPLGRLGVGLLMGIGLAGTVLTAGLAIAVPGPLRIPLVFFAAVLAAGTLTAMLWLHRARTRRAALMLGITWALLLLLVGGWLIPAAEPYRTSRRVGQRLAALEAERGIEPVLLEYQEPGTIYAAGHPLTALRDRRGLHELLEKKGELLTVLTPEEAAAYRDRYDLTIEPIESLEGFSQTKGRGYSLLIATVRRRVGSQVPAPSLSRAGAAEQALVK
jgi:4-amino-4-deoxy-L-arabinose transferase-like glycosyltransferase